MEMRYVHLAVQDAFKSAKKCVLVSHPKPDGDTLGAAAAMLNWCEHQGIPAVGFCVDALSDQFSYLKNIERFTNDYAVFRDPDVDLVAVFDAGDLRFAGIDQAIAAMPKRPVVLNFDHHATNENFGDHNVLDVTAASTTEVVHRFFRTTGTEITRDIATCLLLGLCFDTGNFTNAATTVSSLATGSELFRHGASMNEITRRTLRNKSIPALRMWGQVLARLKYDREMGVATTAVFLDDYRHLDEDHVEGISNFLGRALDLRAILVLKELPGGKVKGSFRTALDLDVSLPAKMLGGGGHKKSAGFTIAGRIKETERAWMVE